MTPDCTTCRWYISSRMLTKAEAKRVHNGEYIKAQSYEQTILKLSLNKADVVEVVRCKDCKWFHRIGCAIEISDKSDEPTDNDYCSFGERAES